MTDMDFLLDDEPEQQEEAAGEPWRVMIVDDDESIHQTTKYALYGFSFLGSTVEWIDAYSAQEAKELALENPNISLIFLDVVMETDNAGLEFARWFRDMDINHATRIILRTGQPGQAPERSAIVEYDLHDYKTKTELTSEKLYTTMITALRSYRDLLIIQQAKAGLSKIIDSMQYLFSLQSMRRYAAGVLIQINALIDFRRSGIICAQAAGENGDMEILAEVGNFSTERGVIEGLIQHSFITREAIHEENYTLLTFVDQHGRLFSIYLENRRKLTDIEMNLLTVFCSSVSVGFGNIKLLEDLKRSHLAIVMALADLAEHRDNDTGAHVVRISQYVTRVAKRLFKNNRLKGKYDNAFLEKVGIAAMLHDVGKVGIPDRILQKPGPLDDEEREIMKTHPEIGAKILTKAAARTVDKKGYLQVATNIALYHHERWDGKGYPKGLCGEEIPIEARVTAVADVYDALRQKRCYKDSFPIEKCKAIIEEGKGTQFDPDVVDTFFEMLSEEGEADGKAFLDDIAYKLENHRPISEDQKDAGLK